jgi:hypothetical protein
MEDQRAYGILAEFDDPSRLVDAVNALRRIGCRTIETYTPYPISEVDEILEGGPDRTLPKLVLLGGLLGALTAWSMQYYIAVIDYPINVGGRPLNSWPAFIVIMFELTILFAALTAFFGSLFLSGLPMPHHPLFNIRDFALSSQNRFFVSVEASDPEFDFRKLSKLLSMMEPVAVREVYED